MLLAWLTTKVTSLNFSIKVSYLKMVNIIKFPGELTKVIPYFIEETIYCNIQSIGNNSVWVRKLIQTLSSI